MEKAKEMGRAKSQVCAYNVLTPLISRELRCDWQHERVGKGG